MEAVAGVSLAANVIQFIDFSCTLVSRGKGLYKNGSLSEYGDLEKVTIALVDYNRRLQESLEPRLSSADGPTEDEKALESIAKDCARIAEQLIRRLQRLNYSGERKLWKSVRSALKSIWSKAEIDDIATCLATYRQQLMLQNQKLAFSSNCELLGILDKKIDPLVHKLEDLSRLLIVAHVSHEAAIPLSTQPTQLVHPPATMSDTGDNNTTANCDCASEEAVPSTQSHSSMSSEQFKVLQDMIGQVLVQVQPRNSSHGLLSPTATSVGEASSSLGGLPAPPGNERMKDSTTCEEVSDLSNTIDELCRFASKKGTALFSEDAQLMIDSLDKILATLEPNVDTAQATVHNLKRTRSPETDHPEGLETGRSIKWIRGLLNSAQCITVNQPGSATHPTLVKGKYASTSKYVALQRPEGKIGLLQKKRRLRRSSDINGDDSQDLVFEYFSATIDYIPSGQMSKFKITANFHQYIRIQSFTSLHPTLTYSAMVPENAEVIRRVKANDVRGMLGLLEQGLASLSDCDPKGRPLLYYAVEHAAPAICRYLVDNKADVDAVSIDDGGFIIPVLEIQDVDECELEPVKLADTYACKRIILEGGADPTVHAYEESALTAVPAFWFALAENSFVNLVRILFSTTTYHMQESIKMILDLAGDFFDIKDCWEGGNAVYWLSFGRGFGLNPDILDFLVGRGAGVLQRHQLYGGTCLQRATVALKLRQNHCSGTKAATFLVKLIRAGLGVFDESFDGDTPWATARRLCMVPRRIFEDALRRCNIDSTGLFVAGENCPIVPLYPASPWDDICWCETSSQTVADLEYSHNLISTSEHDSSEDDASGWLGSEHDHIYDSDFDQSIEGLRDETVSEIGGSCIEAITLAPFVGLNSEGTEQGTHYDVPLDRAASSSHLPRMDFLSTSSQNGRIWSPTGLAYQQRYNQNYTSWTPATPALIPVGPSQGMFHQNNPHISSDPFSADSEHQDTYSSTLAWASEFQQAVEVVETMMDVTTDSSTTAVDRVRQISIADILNP